MCVIEGNRGREKDGADLVSQNHRNNYFFCHLTFILKQFRALFFFI